MASWGDGDREANRLARARGGDGDHVPTLQEERPSLPQIDKDKMGYGAKSCEFAKSCCKKKCGISGEDAVIHFFDSEM